MTRLHLFCLFPVLAPLACGGETDFETPQDPATFQAYFQPETPYQNPACNQNDGALTGQRELVLYRGGSTADSVGLFRFTSGLQRYYSRHGLRFLTRTPPRPVQIDSILNLNEAQLTAELKKKFPQLDLDSSSLSPTDMQAVETFALNFVLRPIIEFAREFGGHGEDKTNVVVLPRLLNSAQSISSMGQIAGLAVSPSLIKAILAEEDPDSEAQLWRNAEFPPGFTPMLFLDAGVLDMASKYGDASGGDLVAAHEFGHSASLIHREREDNLMKPALDRNSISCVSPLDPDQLESMRKTLKVGAPRVAVPAAPPRAPVQRLSAIAETGSRLHGLRSFMRGESPDIPSILKPILHLH